MQGCCFLDIKQVRTQPLADPVIQNSLDAIVQVEMAGLCGSDLHPFFGRETGLDVGTVMGHEFVGRVIEVGPEVTNLKVGDRVSCPFSTNCGNCFYCNIGLTSRCIYNQLFGWRQDSQGLHGGQAEFVLVPNANGSLVHVGDSISNETALLLGDNLSTGFYCAEMAAIHSDGVYLVIGCGTVGLLTILAAQYLGAKKIVAFDLVPERLKMAEQLGASTASTEEAALQEIRSATKGRGADGVMELVGLLPAQEFAYQAIRPGGIMSTIGCHCTPNFGFSPTDAYDKNITYRTGRCPARHYMDQLLPKLTELPMDIGSLITHQFSLSESEKAYDVFSNRKDGCVKAAFSFG